MVLATDASEHRGSRNVSRLCLSRPLFNLLCLTLFSWQFNTLNRMAVRIMACGDAWLILTCARHEGKHGGRRERGQQTWGPSPVPSGVQLCLLRGGAGGEGPEGQSSPSMMQKVFL